MAVDRAAEHRALAAQIWRQVFNLFVGTKGQRDHVLQRLRLSPNDAKTLCTMDPTEAQPMRALADLCCTDASNATWVVDRLESQGLVERRAVPGDRRVKLVGLTPRGLKTRTTIMEAMHEPPLELLALDRDDLVALGKILAKIPLSADATQPKPPAVSLSANRPSPSPSPSPVAPRTRRRHAKQRT